MKVSTQKRNGLRSIAVVSIIVWFSMLLSACSDSSLEEVYDEPPDIVMPVGPDNPPLDLDDVVALLRTTGLEVELGEFYPDEAAVYGVGAQVIHIGENSVATYIYESKEQLEAFKEGISPDGGSIRTFGNPDIIVDIDLDSGTPHYFSTENVMLVYFGYDLEFLYLLENLFGFQFAGG